MQCINDDHMSSADEIANASVYLTDHLKDPETAFSTDPLHTHLTRAFGTKKSAFERSEEPQNELRLKRFGMRTEKSICGDFHHMLWCF